MKIEGSGSISQRHGSADPDPNPDPHQNVMDPQHGFKPYRSVDDAFLSCMKISYFRKFNSVFAPVAK
jgi:hypothetical protein